MRKKVFSKAEIAEAEDTVCDLLEAGEDVSAYFKKPKKQVAKK